MALPQVWGYRRPKGSFDSSLRSSLRMTTKKLRGLMNNPGSAVHLRIASEFGFSR
jgi:hypothetical protein